MKKLITAVMALILIGYVGLGTRYLVSRHNKVQLQEVNLKSTTSDLKELQLKYNLLNSNLDQELQKKNTDADRVKQLESEKQELEKHKLDLEAQLQAKIKAKEQANIAARNAVNAFTGTGTASAAASGDRYAWMAAAGIPAAQQPAAEKLVQRESSWNPNAMNEIGACSLVQALPCSKIPGNWRDPVTALRWGQSYVASRYGTWDAALAHSYAKNWY